MRKSLVIFFLSCLLGSFQSNILAMDYESDEERFDLHQNFSSSDLQRAWAGDKNLAGANLNGADLSKADLSNVILTGAKLNGANLSGANLAGAIFVQTELKGAVLNGTILAGARIEGSDFSNAEISNVVLSQVLIGEYVREIDGTHFATRFVGAIIRNMLIWDSKIRNSDFTNSKILGIKIAASTIENVNMRHITIDEIVIAASLMRNIGLVFAHINKISIQSCPVIGDGLDLSYAIISTGHIRGGIILSGNNGRTEYVSEKDLHEISGTIGGFGGLASGIGLVVLACMAFPPAGVVAGVAVLTSTLILGTSGSIAGMIGIQRMKDLIDEYREQYSISNINSIILNSNFHGTTISDVCFSNIKFCNCASIQSMKMAFGCLFENVISSNPQDLIAFIDKGAKVNGEFSSVFEYAWEGTDYEGFLQRLTLEAVPAFARGVVGGVADAVMPGTTINTKEAR